VPGAEGLKLTFQTQFGVAPFGELVKNPDFTGSNPKLIITSPNLQLPDIVIPKGKSAKISMADLLLYSGVDLDTDNFGVGGTSSVADVEKEYAGEVGGQLHIDIAKQIPVGQKPKYRVTGLAIDLRITMHNDVGTGEVWGAVALGPGTGNTVHSWASKGSEVHYIDYPILNQTKKSFADRYKYGVKVRFSVEGSFQKVDVVVFIQAATVVIVLFQAATTLIALIAFYLLPQNAATYNSQRSDVVQADHLRAHQAMQVALASTVFRSAKDIKAKIPQGELLSEGELGAILQSGGLHSSEEAATMVKFIFSVGKKMDTTMDKTGMSFATFAKILERNHGASKSSNSHFQKITRKHSTLTQPSAEAPAPSPVVEHQQIAVEMQKAGLEEI
jgi:hypothetical protein